MIKLVYATNGERFAGLNFHIFHSFQEHCESFPVNILFILYMVFFKCRKCNKPQKYFREKLHWVYAAKFSPVNLSLFTVRSYN